MAITAIFASGNGSNFQRIIEALNAHEAEGFTVACLIVDKKDAYAIQRAKELRIPCFYVNPKEFLSKSLYENKIYDILQGFSVEYIILAGYMRIISSTLLNLYPNKIINIHPSLLPDLPGKNSIEEAFITKRKYTGVSIHYVNEDVDAGQIITQEKIEISPHWSLEELKTQVHKVEHLLYPQTLTKLFRRQNETSSH